MCVGVWEKWENALGKSSLAFVRLCFIVLSGKFFLSVVDFRALQKTATFEVISADNLINVFNRLKRLLIF